MGSRLHETRHCPICTAAEVTTDEVFDGGRWLLAECPRCRHRWTEQLPAPPRVRSLRRSLPTAAEDRPAA